LSPSPCGPCPSWRPARSPAPPPRPIRALGRFLPAAILALLLIHTLVGFIRQDAPTVGAWPTLIAILVTVGLQWRWRHALLSIFAGTGVYVLLRNAPMLF